MPPACEIVRYCVCVVWIVMVGEGVGVRSESNKCCSLVDWESVRPSCLTFWVLLCSVGIKWKRFVRHSSLLPPKVPNSDRWNQQPNWLKFTSVSSVLWQMTTQMSIWKYDSQSNPNSLWNLFSVKWCQRITCRLLTHTRKFFMAVSSNLQYIRVWKRLMDREFLFL